MRDIKFRAWKKYTQKYLKADELLINLSNGNLQNLAGGAFRQTDLVLEQYTGLKDKNGVEIYENDVISALVFGFEEKGIVEYSPFGEWLFGNIRLNEFMSSLTVIGNVHENAGLLEEQ